MIYTWMGKSDVLRVIHPENFNHGEHGEHGEVGDAPWREGKSLCPQWLKTIFILSGEAKSSRQGASMTRRMLRKLVCECALINIRVH